jgi:hypothetical protein
MQTVWHGSIYFTKKNYFLYGSRTVLTLAREVDAWALSVSSSSLRAATSFSKAAILALLAPSLTCDDALREARRPGAVSLAFLKSSLAYDDALREVRSCGAISPAFFASSLASDDLLWELRMPSLVRGTSTQKENFRRGNRGAEEEAAGLEVEAEAASLEAEAASLEVEAEAMGLEAGVSVESRGRGAGQLDQGQSAQGKSSGGGSAADVALILIFASAIDGASD